MIFMYLYGLNWVKFSAFLWFYCVVVLLHRRELTRSCGKDSIFINVCVCVRTVCICLQRLWMIWVWFCFGFRRKYQALLVWELGGVTGTMLLSWGSVVLHGILRIEDLFLCSFFVVTERLCRKWLELYVVVESGGWLNSVVFRFHFEDMIVGV